MSNKDLGKLILGSYFLAIILFIAGSYTDAITSWDQLGYLASILGFGFSLWAAVRLLKSPS